MRHTRDGGTAMGVAENKAAVQRFVDEVMNGGNLAVVDGLLTAGCLDRTPPSPDFPAGSEGVRAQMAMLRGAFPDLSVTIEDMVGAGETVSSRWTMRGTNSGSFLGMPPTGKAIQIEGIDMIRFRDGK